MSGPVCFGRLFLLLALFLSQPIFAEESARDRAKAFVEEGALAYQLGRFTEALAAYEKAYEAERLPALLFNIGQCHKMLGDHERAIFFFEGFLRERPEAKSRPLVETLIAESKRELEQQAHQAAAAKEEELR